MTALAVMAILQAGATPYFYVFWRWFDFWRRHQLGTYAMMLGTFALLGLGVYAFRGVVLGGAVALPAWAPWLGWANVALVTVFGFVADRQIGFRVRSFTPFFEPKGRLELRTTGAYAVVRHPLYASGVGFQPGVFLVTGVPAVLVAWAVFTVGALWFTRQEERRLVELLDDPTAYARYRERVPALLPRLWPRR
jgi:protein-S-isoprenylcysteine O-methyltransferase Ste14